MINMKMASILDPEFGFVDMDPGAGPPSALDLTKTYSHNEEKSAAVRSGAQEE